MTQDELYLRAIAELGPALARLVSAYEPDADQRRDLLQDVHFALWRSFASFAGQCSRALARLKILIRRLTPPDDQVMLLYLEDIDAASIAEITGLSARAVATRIHRIKALLSRQFRQGGTDE